MSEAVLDSGILIASVFPETLTKEAQSLLQKFRQQNIVLHALILFRYELFAVSRKAVYQLRISPEEGLNARHEFLNYPITLHFDDALLVRAYELATEYNRPTAYDAQYLAVSERLECAFWTADERLYNAINGKFPYIHWLGSIKLD